MIFQDLNLLFYSLKLIKKTRKDNRNESCIKNYL